MNALTSNPILEFNSNQIMDVRKLFGYEDQNRLQQDIKILDNWIKKQQHFLVKTYDETYLERHLIRSKGSVEKAKKHIDKLFTLRGIMPEYLQGFDIKNEFNNFIKVSYICVLPKPTPDNYRLIFHNFITPDATLYEGQENARYLLLIIEYLNMFDYNAGIELILDTRNITLGIITKLSPIVITNCFTIITEAIGLRVKALHIISGSKVIDAFLAIVKRALTKKLMSRLHIHERYETVFKFIPKNILPKDIGGDLSTTIEEIHDSMFNVFSSPEFIQIMRHTETAVTDESKRLSSKFNEDYSGLPGSFKYLTVD